MNRTAPHAELIAAKRAIALGKITAFDAECWRLAGLVNAGELTVVETVQTLADADDANSLSDIFGADYVQQIMADAFAAGIYGVSSAEAAA